MRRRRRYSKAAVDFGKGTGEAHCGLCEHLRSRPGGTRGCDEVAGEIDTAMWCIRFERNERARAPEAVASDMPAVAPRRVQALSPGEGRRAMMGRAAPSQEGRKSERAMKLDRLTTFAPAVKASSAERLVATGSRRIEVRVTPLAAGGLRIEAEVPSTLGVLVLRLQP